MTVTQVTGPSLPTGLVIHPALGLFADGDDTDVHPDLHLLDGLSVQLTASVRAVVWRSPTGDVTLVPSVVTGKYDSTGRLRLVLPGGALSTSDGIRLAATSHPSMEAAGGGTWHWKVEWGSGKLPSGILTLTSGQIVNLSSVILNSAVPGAPGQNFNDLLVAARDLREAIVAGGGSVPSAVPGTFMGVRTAAQWATFPAPIGTGPWWGVST